MTKPMIRSRLLMTVLTHSDESGWGIVLFDWAIATTTIVVILYCIWRKLRNDSNNTDDTNPRNTESNIDVEAGETDSTPRTKTAKENEEEKRNRILELLQSEQIQQKITCDHIRNNSCKTIDTLSTEEFDSDDGHSIRHDTDNSLDEDEGQGMVVISQFPLDGRKPLPKNTDDGETLVSNLCAICLEEYHEGDTIVWSCNRNCRHAFHRDCLTTYLVKLKDEDSYPCPYCRQDFFFKHPSEKGE